MPRVRNDRALRTITKRRKSHVDLAKEVGASERTVQTHIRTMEENGTIRGYTVRGVDRPYCPYSNKSVLVEIGSFASEVTGWEGA